ncbi:GNAT family N-acetyltransferase [Exiguobacterium undae]|uniref:GNAT family N-acetyltransferase n=1 Tax=Exiguobacterium undae TaxID=169177 RepID=UPI00384C28BD
MHILPYGQLSHYQRRLVHQLLQNNRFFPPVITPPPAEHQQWTIWEGDTVCATVGLHVFENSVQILNAAYTNLQAFRALAHDVHFRALSYSPKHIDVQIIPPHDFGLVSTWTTLGYVLSSEQFRLIGLTHERVPSVQFKPLTLRNRHLFLNIRNDAVRTSDFLFSYELEHLNYLIDQGALPYLVYDQKTVIGTIVIQTHKQTVRLLEMACLPQLKNQGYGRRILDTFQAKLRKKNILSFEVYCFSAHQEALRLYQPALFCDLQIFSHWHRYCCDTVSLTT